MSYRDAEKFEQESVATIIEKKQRELKEKLDKIMVVGAPYPNRQG